MEVFNVMIEFELGSQIVSQWIATNKTNDQFDIAVQQGRVLAKQNVRPQNCDSHDTKHLQNRQKEILTDASHGHLHQNGRTNGHIQNNIAQAYFTENDVQFVHQQYIVHGQTDEIEIVNQCGPSQRSEQLGGCSHSIDDVHVVHGHAKQ